MWVVLIQSVEGQKSSKRSILLRVKENFSWLRVNRDILFPVFTLKLKHWLFLGLEPASLRTRTTLSILLGLWLPIHPLDLGNSHPLNYMRRFSIMYLHVYIHIHPSYWFCFSGGSWLIQSLLLSSCLKPDSCSTWVYLLPFPSTYLLLQVIWSSHYF